MERSCKFEIVTGGYALPRESAVIEERRAPQPLDSPPPLIIDLLAKEDKTNLQRRLAQATEARKNSKGWAKKYWKKVETILKRKVKQSHRL